MNRPGNVDRPIINRPGSGNVINSGNVNVNRPTINNTIINQNVNRVTNVRNPIVINRPGGVVRPVRPIGGVVVGYPGFYGGYVPPSYPVAVPSYAPMLGYPTDYVGRFHCPYEEFDPGWRRSFWDGFTGSVVTGLAIAAASRPATVVYQNPYQTAPAIVDSPPVVPRELDYSQPIEVPTEKDLGSLDEEIIRLGMQTFERARERFKKGEYALALEDVEKAIRLAPGDTTMHEVRALSLFALGKYQESAGAIYAVLSSAPGSTWDSLGQLYPEPAVYQKQLKTLEDSIREGKEEPWRRFLLGYHYVMLGEREAALEEFRLAAKGNDKDQVSPSMVAFLEKATGFEPREGEKDSEESR